LEGRKIKLGLIGSSEGNGHPYSWSAIFNGYDPERMARCEYPVIPKYLKQEKWPEARITSAEVSAIWTQDIDMSKKIAGATGISKVCKNLSDLGNEVDGILLARDDSENHLRLAEPFLRAGLPIYIDKPIALSEASLDELIALEQYEGQIFTCSALRFSEELYLDPEELKEIGEIKEISAIGPKSWEKYGVHLVDPVLRILYDFGIVSESSSPSRSEAHSSGAIRNLGLVWPGGVQTSFSTSGQVETPIQITIRGNLGERSLRFTKPFPAFRKALLHFVEGATERSVTSPMSFNRQVVRILEEGLD